MIHVEAFCVPILGLTTTTSAHPNKHQLPFNQNISPEVKLRSARHNQLPPYQSLMASATLTHPSSLSHTSSPLPTVSRTYPFIASLSNTALSFSYPKNQILRSITFVPQTGLASFSSWNGLRHNGFSISLKSLRFEKRKKCRGKVVFASLFGVGAPEALVIGVVALLVFGPKGLAEIAKNLGQTLRTFQPTIRELQEVSREFKSTLEKEIGLDELKNPALRNTNNIPTLSSTPLSVSTSENSQATTTETPAAATTASTNEDFQAAATPLGATTEDSQATPATPVGVTEDSQVIASPLDVTTGDSQALATTPAAT
ncbi:sec-independent protein translocase protein TATB, chloroplastic [Lactuca sativa]|uniref:sec-independent protein translocase protein TATB, chloroplastic n=1 Tax=Lactuca sativa TaxID=4236 RepID=UPI000CD804A6|nr:sec-independent protein translocase protein TATB, chloroplastic [Lactuca sativa]